MISTHQEIDPANIQNNIVRTPRVVSGDLCMPIVVKIVAKKIIISGFEIVRKNVELNNLK